MDVQGSRYHLLHGRGDWARCVDTASGIGLGVLWAAQADGVPSTVPTAWEYDESDRVLRLRRDTPLFHRAGRHDPLALDSRRGAARDGYGTWYWIDAGRDRIRGLRTGERVAWTWWSVADLAATCTCAGDRAAGGFTGECSCDQEDLVLQGLTVTTHHYLLAGFTSTSGPGLLVFDLHGGGTPLRMRWPAEFDPWDFAETPDGGALLADRTHAAYWRLDEHLRLPGTQSATASTFAPVGSEDPVTITGPLDPTPFHLADAAGAPVHPISIHAGPEGSVLVLDADPARGYSVLYRYDGGTLTWQTPLVDVVEVSDPDDPTGTSFRYSVLGHDFCYAEAEGPLDPPLLYLADAEGEQVIAFHLDPAGGGLVARDDFLPMRRWAGRALVATPDGVHYDFGERWISLQVYTECRFAAEATLVTAADFTDELPGDTFDSGIPDCSWHRLLLDAHIPTGATVTIRARASDDPLLLDLEGWLPQPAPYLRGDGSELPWADPWADRRGDVRRPLPLPTGTGTWELLLQYVRGRYLQLEITLTGGGRATPLLRSLRAWYPRYSYVEHHLPAVYAENDTPAGFLERFLANPEGIFTALEERIEHSHMILDARTARGSDLPWLACWFGLALDPQWDEARRRFLVAHLDRFYRIRGTVLGLVATLRVYLDPVVDEGVFRRADSGSGGVRVVERFLTRDTGGAAYGAPSTVPDPDPMTRVRRSAHRFDLVVPAELSTDQTRMVERIVETAKPAHTSFGVLHYVDLMVVGQARLGLDTEVGAAPTFGSVVPGTTTLPGGYLGYPHPFELTDRVVSDRDRAGTLPPL